MTHGVTDGALSQGMRWLCLLHAFCMASPFAASAVFSLGAVSFMMLGLSQQASMQQCVVLAFHGSHRHLRHQAPNETWATCTAAALTGSLGFSIRPTWQQLTKSGPTVQHAVHPANLQKARLHL